MSPSTELHGSFLSRLSFRRYHQIVSMDANHEQQLQELEYFQSHVSERFSEFISPSPPPSDSLLSIPWLQSLLHVFTSCETEFREVLLTTAQIPKTPSLEKVLTETLDRIVKALDICNAVVNGIESVKQSRSLAEIAVTALKQRPLCSGSVRRARRALTSLLSGSNVNAKDSSRRRTTSRSWSFGQRSSVSKNWSAGKQIQAMAANLVLPRGAEASGPAMMPVYIMSSVMVLVMWVLVAAVPCQTSSVPVAPLQLPKHQSWASAAANVQERVGEEVKGKEKRGGGLMEEMQRMESVGLFLMEFTERFRFPADEEDEEEVEEKVDEMDEICRRMEVGLEDLQRQVRAVFQRLVRIRLEIVSVLDLNL
ncbi:hypothetical protein HA466_0166510 [Hirschfeldia incana]|nr:hypothetical protein HA466_0166510 [Hirschfeldia incana]